MKERALPTTEQVAESGDRPAVPGLQTIVVGVDERSASQDALTLAKVLREHSGARLVAASVRAYWPELIGVEEYERVLAEDQSWLRRTTLKVLGDSPFSTYVVGGGHETEGLKEIAAAEQADLIVVGSTHRGRIGRVLPGSAGERVLNNAPCAVAIAPLGLAATGLRLDRVAVAYDGSKEARIALDLGSSLAGAAGASLQILGAVEIGIDTVGLQPVSKEGLEESRMRRHLEQAESSIPASIPVQTRLLHGAANHVLPEAAQEADLLILGSRGHYGRVRRLFMGSVATAVTRNAPCATLITPAG
jgi:nucleotide-binding universal stress UspA family protein